MSIIANALLAGSVLASGLTGVAPAVDTAPVQPATPAIEQQAETRSATTSTYGYKYNANTVSHYLQAQSYTSAENGRTAWWSMEEGGGRIVKSGSVTMSNGYGTNVFTDMSDLPAGTYQIVYNYFDGKTSHTAYLNVTKNASQITSVTPNPFGVG